MVLKSTKIMSGATGGFFVVSVVACVVFFYHVSVQKERFREQSIARAELQAHKDALTSLTRTLEETQEERESLASRIVKEEMVIDLLGLIETLGREQGVVLTTTSLNVEPISNTFEALVIGVNVRGSYEALMHVLTLLEHLPYQSTVNKVHVDRGDGVLWSGSFEVRVTKFKKI